MFRMAISLASVTTLTPMWDTKSVAISTPIRYVGALKTSASINEVALEAAPAKIQPDVFNKDDNAVKKNKLSSSSRIRRISRKRNPAKGKICSEISDLVFLNCRFFDLLRDFVGKNLQYTIDAKTLNLRFSIFS